MTGNSSYIFIKNQSILPTSFSTSTLYIYYKIIRYPNTATARPTFSKTCTRNDNLK